MTVHAVKRARRGLPGTRHVLACACEYSALPVPRFLQPMLDANDVESAVRHFARDPDYPQALLPHIEQP